MGSTLLEKPNLPIRAMATCVRCVDPAQTSRLLSGSQITCRYSITNWSHAKQSHWSIPRGEPLFLDTPDDGLTGYSGKPLVVLNPDCPASAPLPIHGVICMSPPYKDTHKLILTHKTPCAFYTFVPRPTWGRHVIPLNPPPPIIISFDPAISFPRDPPPQSYQLRPPHHRRPA
jgi:hypothetical protein